MLAFLCGPVARPAPAQPETLDRILAVVSGHVIMSTDIRAFIQLGLVDIASADRGGTDAEEAVLSALIERRLVLDEVDRYVVAGPPPARIERELVAIGRRFDSPDAFAATLERIGFSEDDLRQILVDEARREAYLEERFGAASRGDARAQLIADWVSTLSERGQVVRFDR